MKRKRRTHSAEFKARVALEALKGVKTINQIAQDEGVLPVQVSTWKKELQVGMPAVFQSGAKHRQDEEKAERDRARLERKVGQLVVEREFLEKKCEQLGIDLSERP
jgi:transposase-like protein